MASVHRVDARNFNLAYGPFISVARSCRSPFVFLDSEFPGDIHQSTKHYTLLSATERYALLKLNAEAMRPIQFGITLSDGISFSSTWQFDLRDFNIRYHPHAADSIAMLESAGIDFKRNTQLGIHSTSLARLLLDAGLIGLYSGATWVAFHGCYDFALLMKALFQLTTRLPVTLPETLEEFMGVSRCLFGGAIYDVKCVMKHCEGLYGGLERVAKKLSVERAAGKAHQAGSDSLLTCHVFLKMKMMFFGHVDDGEEEKMPSEGLIFDIKQFEDQLYAEIRARIKEDDISVPIRRGSYYYYERTLQGKEYVLHCRSLITNGTASVHDVMPMGPDAPEEHVILDENLKAQGHDYYRIGAFKASPNNKFIAYAEDTKGDEIYTVYVIDADKGTFVGNPLKGVTSYVEWAGDDTLVYITMDEILRPDKIWSHKLLSEQSSDECLYHEKDDMFSVDLQISETKQYIFVGSESKETRFIYYLGIYNQTGGLRTLTPRLYGIDTSASHRGNHFFIKRRSEEIFNSELVYCPVDNPSETKVLLPHRERVKIQDFQLFSGHVAVYERENGLQKVIVYSLPPIGEAIGPLQGGRAVGFVDPIYAVEPEESQFSSAILRFSYSSMKTPPSVYDYDMNLGISILKKIKPVLGGFESSDYLTKREWAVASDGTKIPISILYKKNLVMLDGSNPLLLYGYGSYEASINPSFRASALSLVDRGFIYAIAHVRGGGEMGRKWYEDGKLLKKRNTFTDFIASTEYLIENKYCSREKLCIYGASAGGLLIGAVLNMRPDLFMLRIVPHCLWTRSWTNL